MEPQFPPPSAVTHSLVDAPPFPPPPAFTTKLRLMCSYGGHIVHRPQTNNLFYACGETRIIAVDRLTTAFSLASLMAHLSRTLYNNRPFHLKYQLPDEGLDSLISVTTDEDLQNMLEEHDRVAPKSSRIRLFLFPVKPESLGSALLDPKSESWFSDALSNTGIERRIQSTGSNLPCGLIGLDVAEGVGDAKHGGSGHESLVLETSSSFGSTSSFVSMSNSPAFGVQCEDGTASLHDKRVRVPSSASIESDNSVGSVASQPKPAICQEPFAQVFGIAPSCTIEPGSPIANPSTMIPPQKTVQVPAYEFPDGKMYKHRMQYVNGGPYYLPQYPTTPSQLSSCYPLYHVPMLQQQQSPYHLNQPYPIYLVPLVPNQSLNMPMQCGVNDATDISSVLPRAVIPPPILHKETLAAKHVPEPAPSTECQESFVGPLEPNPSSQPVDTVSHSNEFDDDVSYSQIYKTQPTAPSFISQCQTITKGATVQFSESPMQQTPNDVMAQASSLLQIS